MKQIANYISIMRIFLALTLILIEPLSIEFIIIYLVCGISDIFDGYIARRTVTVSEIGGKIDSIADLIFFLVLIIRVYPVITLSLRIIVWIASISIIRLASIIIVFVKYKTFGILHTYGNKVAGIALFTLPLILVFDQLYALIYIACVIACAASIEELFINLTSSEFKINQRSIISKQGNDRYYK